MRHQELMVTVDCFSILYSSQQAEQAWCTKYLLDLLATGQGIAAQSYGFLVISNDSTPARKRGVSKHEFASITYGPLSVAEYEHITIAFRSNTLLVMRGKRKGKTESAVKDTLYEARLVMKSRLDHDHAKGFKEIMMESLGLDILQSTVSHMWPSHVQVLDLDLHHGPRDRLRPAFGYGISLLALQATGNYSNVCSWWICAWLAAEVSSTRVDGVTPGEEAA